MGTITVGGVRFHAHSGDHHPPHVHAKIGSGEVVLDLIPGDVDVTYIKKRYPERAAQGHRDGTRLSRTTRHPLEGSTQVMRVSANPTDAELDAIIEQGERQPKTADAIDARYLAASDQIAVRFDNGIEVRIPRLSIEGLENATREQLEAPIEIEAGRGLAWPAVSDQVVHCIPNLLDGFGIPCRTWTELGRRGGLKTSPAKAAAGRANGKKGGRPKARALKA
jgi:hypothetical protein